MKVITIGREFGSGGREFGKLLAQELGFDFYDDEILTEIAKKSGLAQSYVRSVVEQSSFEDYSVSYGKNLFFNDFTSDNHLKIITSQNDVLLELAKKSNSVFVGRCADVVLDKLNPLKIFVYADMDTKLARSKASTFKNDRLTDKEILKQIKEVEKKRTRYYRAITDRPWGAKENYHLCINTTGKEIKDLVPTAAAFAQAWFR